jgi:hypothetical protein
MNDPGVSPVLDAPPPSHTAHVVTEQAVLSQPAQQL